MMDMGYVVIAIFIGIFAMVLWPRGLFKRKAGSDETPQQPGRRLEGAHLMNDDGGSDGGGGGE